MSLGTQVLICFLFFAEVAGDEVQEDITGPKTARSYLPYINEARSLGFWV